MGRMPHERLDSGEYQPIRGWHYPFSLILCWFGYHDPKPLSHFINTGPEIDIPDFLCCRCLQEPK